MQEEDDAVGVCSECRSEQSDNSMFKNPFAQAGIPPACKYCGGVVVIVYKNQKDRSLDQLDRERGL